MSLSPPPLRLWIFNYGGTSLIRNTPPLSLLCSLGRLDGALRCGRQEAGQEGGAVTLCVSLSLSPPSSPLSRPYAFFFVFTLVIGPRRSLRLKLSDTRVYEP